MKTLFFLMGILIYSVSCYAQVQTIDESYAQDYCVNEFCPTHIFDEKYKGQKVPYWSLCFKDCCHQLKGCGIDNTALIKNLN